jgi:hypothetical protein
MKDLRHGLSDDEDVTTSHHLVCRASSTDSYMVPFVKLLRPDEHIFPISRHKIW